MKILAWILIFLLLSGCQVVPLEPLESVQKDVLSEESASEPELTIPEQSAEEDSGYEPVTLVSLDEIGVTAIGYAADMAWGPTLTLELRNETEQDLLFCADYAKSDGVMCNPYWNCTVTAGETVESKVFWSGEMLQKSGIFALGELVLELEICHSEDHSAILFSDAVSLHLKTENAPAQMPPVWEGFPEQTLAEGDGFGITAVGFAQNEQPTLTLRLNNQTEVSLLCTVTDVLVNGESCDPEWAAVVMQEAILYSEITWETEEKVEEISMTLSVYNRDDRTAEALFSGEVTVSLPNT